MQVEQVQKWIMSALLLTVATVFAGGMCVLAGSREQAGATPGLLVIAAVVGLLAMAGVRVINERRVVTPWLLCGLLPSSIGVYFLYLH